jgi:hypothetical protein
MRGGVVQNDMVWERGAQKLSRNHEIYSMNPLRLGRFRFGGSLVHRSVGIGMLIDHNRQQAVGVVAARNHLFVTH